MKGKVPMFAAVLLTAVAVVAIFGVASFVSGERPIAGATGQQYLPLQAVPQQQAPQAQPSQPLQAVPSAGDQFLSVKEYAITVREPYSLSGTAYAGTMRIYPSGINLLDPNAVATDTVSISSGAGSKTSWNKFRTGTPYTVVLDGDGTYYNTLLARDSVFFETSKYNKALGTYTHALGDIGSDRLKSSDIPNADFIGEKIGTYSVTFSNNVSANVTVGGTAVNYNETATDATGTFSYDMEIKNSAGNTLIKDAVIDWENDQTNTLEGNEFTAATVQHKSGTDFGIPSDVINYITSYATVKLGSLKGGVAGTQTWSFTVAEANTEDAETLHQYLDDLGGYRANDILIGDLGIAATDRQIVFKT